MTKASKSGKAVEPLDKKVSEDSSPPKVPSIEIPHAVSVRQTLVMRHFRSLGRLKRRLVLLVRLRGSNSRVLKLVVCDHDLR